MSPISNALVAFLLCLMCKYIHSNLAYNVHTCTRPDYLIKLQKLVSQIATSVNIYRTHFQ